MMFRRRSDEKLTVQGLQRLLAVARGDEPGDLLLRNGRVVDVFSGEIREADVMVCGDTIASVGGTSGRAGEILDCEGAVLLPGFIDGHVHVESSLLTVAEFARAVVPRGTTSVIIDPHEIANVLGLGGIRYMLEASRHLPLSVFVMVPSCVPATPLETAGAVLDEAAVEEALGYDGVIGLGEMMNVPGLVSGSPHVLSKLAAAREAGLVIDGHAPGVGGAALQAYVAAGVESDHECTTPEEAMDKLRLGLWIMIREGSAAKNLADLLPIVNSSTARRCLFVTDDRHPEDLRRQGHMDHILRRAVALGLDPVEAVRLASTNAAQYFGLRDRGAIAPGYRADLAVVDDLRHFQVDTVLKSGHIVVRGGCLTADVPAVAADAVRGTVHMPPLSVDSFRLESRGPAARVIGLVEGQIVTRKLVRDVSTVDGAVVSDPDRDVLKMAVIERHRGTGRMGLGLVHGFGLKSGAVASSVAHDSHNIIVVGVDDGDMLCAVQHIEKMGGGFVVVSDGAVRASLPLPIAGLLSDEPLERVCDLLGSLHRAARDLGVRLESPLATLSFLALPVIPELKLTDQGLVDVASFQLIDVFE